MITSYLTNNQALNIETHTIKARITLDSENDK